MFEQKLKRLEEIVHAMDGDELELEKALSLFEEGVRVTKECQEHLNQAEQKVRLLLGVDASGNPISKDFKANESEK